MYGSGFKTGCIGSERNPQEHAQKKRDLSAAFSTKSLSQQEEIIQRCIDGFITKIGDCSSRSADGINMVKWYEMVAFDAMGEMAFGESFHCIEKGYYFPISKNVFQRQKEMNTNTVFVIVEEHHPWMDLILDHMWAITLVDNLRRYALLAVIGKYLAPWLTVSARDKHTKYSRTKVQE